MGREREGGEGMEGGGWRKGVLDELLFAHLRFSNGKYCNEDCLISVLN